MALLAIESDGALELLYLVELSQTNLEYDFLQSEPYFVRVFKTLEFVSTLFTFLRIHWVSNFEIKLIDQAYTNRKSCFANWRSKKSKIALWVYFCIRLKIY